MGLIRSYFALFENFDGALGKFQKNEQGFAYNDTSALGASHRLIPSTTPPAEGHLQAIRTTAMEFMSSLQSGLDDRKPSLFGNYLHCQVPRYEFSLTISRITLRTTALFPHPALASVPPRRCYTSSAAIPSSSSKFLR